jgi:hypothetical protein
VLPSSGVRQQQRRASAPDRNRPHSGGDSGVDGSSVRNGERSAGADPTLAGIRGPFGRRGSYALLCELSLEPDHVALVQLPSAGVVDARAGCEEGTQPFRPIEDVLQRRRAGDLLGLRVHEAEPTGTVQRTAVRSRFLQEKNY